MERKRGNTNIDFKAAIAHKRRIGHFDHLHGHISPGEYRRSAKNAMLPFSPEQVLLLNTEEFLNQPANVLSQMHQFAEIEGINLEHKKTFQGS